MKRLLLSIGFLPVIYVALAIAGGIIPFEGRRTSAEKLHPIYLASGPIHYDFVLPLNIELQNSLRSLNYPQLHAQDARTLIIGWGAKSFYTTVGDYTDLSGQAILRGIFGDESVMRLDVIGALPSNHNLKRIMLSGREYQKFLEALRNSFLDGKPLALEGHTQTDAFFAAKGRFNVLQTCNVWIGQTLRRAGVPFGVWTPLPLSVTLSHQIYHSS